MKKIIVAIVLCMCMVAMPTKKSHAIVWVVVKAAAKKVIKAIDLGIQRAQNKVIWLQNAQKTIENTMSKLRLDEITDWTKKQKEQYQKYFDELHQVKQLISYYSRIKEITQKSTRLVSAYRYSWNLVRNDKHFTSKEIEYMERVYTGIMTETAKNVDQLAMIINSFQTQMSDAKRMQMINEAGDRVDENYGDLIKFNQQNGLLSAERAQDKDEINRIKSLYGLALE